MFEPAWEAPLLVPACNPMIASKIKEKINHRIGEDEKN